MTESTDLPSFLPGLFGQTFADRGLPIWLPYLCSGQQFANPKAPWDDASVYSGAYWGAPGELFVVIPVPSSSNARLPAIGEFAIGQETDAPFPLIVWHGEATAEFASTTAFAALIESGRAKLSINVELKVRKL